MTYCNFNLEYITAGRGRSKPMAETNDIYIVTHTSFYTINLPRQTNITCMYFSYFSVFFALKGNKNL